MQTIGLSHVCINAHDYNYYARYNHNYLIQFASILWLVWFAGHINKLHVFNVGVNIQTLNTALIHVFILFNVVSSSYIMITLIVQNAYIINEHYFVEFISGCIHVNFRNTNDTRFNGTSNDSQMQSATANKTYPIEWGNMFPNNSSWQFLFHVKN